MVWCGYLFLIEVKNSNHEREVTHFLLYMPSKNVLRSIDFSLAEHKMIYIDFNA